LTTPTAWAADPERANIKPDSAATGEAQKVTVTSGRGDDTAERRKSSAAKLIFGREELDRNGDSTLGEVLKRLPGITLGGPAGRGGDARLRGLGNGYTQILLNGERAPRGFSIESLSPDQVERVEIIRGPVAEFSTRAIAGTVNIVLREGYQQKDTQIRIGNGFEQGRHSANLSITYPGKRGGLTYSLAGSVFASHQANHSLVHNLSFSPNLSQIQNVLNDSKSHSRGIHLTPRLSWRFESGDTLVFQPLLVHSSNDSSGHSLINQQIDPVLPYASASFRNHNSSDTVRGFGNWQHRLTGAAKLNLKFGFGLLRSQANGTRLQFDQLGALQNTILDANATRDKSVNLGSKFTTPFPGGHLLATGLDVEMSQRDQTSSSLNNGRAEFTTSGDTVSARTRHLSGFVQDEWDITEKWSTNLGLRWESIRTTSHTRANQINNTSHVLSPVLHNVWRLPGETKDQVRLGLTRSYRAPTLNDLTAAPTLSRLNSATRPDSQGNPDLRPELATGVDLAFEHYLTRSGIMSVNIFRRNLTDLIRRTTTLQNGRWVSSPANFGRANTNGVELEAKFQLAELMDDAPNLDVRANYSHFWSRVQVVPGPNNRLDSQPQQTGNFGLDYRLPKVPVTVGGSFNWTAGYATRTSATESSANEAKRQLDLYVLWKYSPLTQIRFSANNLLHRDGESETLVVTGNGAQSAQTDTRTYATFRIQLEFKI
jgi:iron complex outermembrane receptor protein